MGKRKNIKKERINGGTKKIQMNERKKRDERMEEETDGKEKA